MQLLVLTDFMTHNQSYIQEGKIHFPVDDTLFCQYSQIFTPLLSGQA